MYQVLYRKWRPKKFEDVVGQVNITKTLQNEIMTNHVAHAYLFTGSRGTGKTTCARIFSLAVNCREPLAGNPCGVCDICKESDLSSLLDISEIDAASNNGVENIRSIREETYLVPNLCKYRVYIIDEAHMLSSSAFNALLKILEEPPIHVIFILATTEANKIPATITSRCQRFEFHRICREGMTEKIKFICKCEGIEITDQKIENIVKLADGSMRDALSLLDRCVSSAGKDLKNESIDEILGVTDINLTEKLFCYIIGSDAESSFKLIEKLYNESKSMVGLCENILNCFRQEMIQIISNKDGILYSRLSYILKCMDILQICYKNMANGSNKKIEVEIACAKICFINSITQTNDIEKLEPKNDNTVPATENKAPPNIKKYSVENNKNLQPDTISYQKTDTNCGDNQIRVFKDWPMVLKYLSENAKSKSMVISLKGSKAYERDNVIFIDSDKSVAIDLLKEPYNKIDVDRAVREITGKTYKIDGYKRKIEVLNQIDPLDKFASDTCQKDISIKFE